MADVADAITIPDDLLPADGRFGAGPSKIRVEALTSLADTGSGGSPQPKPEAGHVRPSGPGSSTVVERT